MLRVGLDTTPLIGPRTGVGQFTAGLLQAMMPLADVTTVEMTWRGRRRGSRPLPARPMRALWRRMNYPPIEWWTGPVDLMHGTNYVVPPTKRAAQLASVHDLTAVHFPTLCTHDTLEYPALVKRALGRGSHIHCDSRFVADEVIEWSKCSAERVHVVAPGIPTSHMLQPVRTQLSPLLSGAPNATAGRIADELTDQLTGQIGGRPFALVLGTIEPRKDHPSVLRAFAEVCTSDPDLVLVVAGADGWGDAAYVATHDELPEKVRARIIRARTVSDLQRDVLVAGARMLVYPSLYEGFGFPPLEAMAAGVPVIATDAGSLPEVLGPAAAFVRPGDVDGLAEQMLRVHTDDAVRASLVARGTAQAAGYSWERCAAEMLTVYERTIAAK